MSNYNYNYSYIAFCGDVEIPVLFSFNKDKWYYPDGLLFTEYKMNDSVPIPGKNYGTKSIPDSRYTIVKINFNDKVALICEDNLVFLLVNDNSIDGNKNTYIKDFYLVCRNPIRLTIIE